MTNVVTNFKTSYLYNMATLKYRFRPSTIKNEKGGQVQLDFSFGRGKRIQKKTGISLANKKHWNENKQTVSITSEEPMHNTYNAYLRELKNQILEKYDTSLIQKEVFDNSTLTKILQQFNNFIYKEPEITPQQSFIELFKGYRSNLLDKSIRGSKTIKASTAKAINTKLKFLETFFLKLDTIEFQDVNEQLYHNIVNHCYKHKFSDNYTGKIISDFKTFCKHIIKKHHTSLPNFDPEEWTAPREDVYNIFLTLDEINLIEELDLGAHPKIYENVRDLFLIGCSTGLRVSDYNKLSKEHIFTSNKKQYFKVWSQKTGEESIIPVSKKVQNIITKNNGLPSSVADQKINEVIKEIGQLAGINEKVRIRKTLGGKTSIKEYLKYELIQTHTARRSFCTNAYLEGLDSLAIMAISGHKTEKMFMKYIKVTKQQYAERIGEHPFFGKI